MIELHIILIAALTAAACAIPGVFLIHRKMALMSDAISHSVLPGIVIALLLTHDLNSPFLLIGAAAMGLLMVALIELINKTRLVKEDASIGLVFPALFSIGVILISQDLSHVHFHESTVLVGDIALSVLNRFTIGGTDIGPKALYEMLGLLLINILFIVTFFKELKISTFDTGLAASFGFNPVLIHYLFMALVSVTTVGAFDVAGSILVIALMIAPASTAYLLTDNLVKMLFISAVIGILSAVSGFYIAQWLNASPAGSMAMMTGFWFLLAYLFAPQRGVIRRVQQRKRQKTEFAKKILLVHISHHSGTPDEQHECRLSNLSQHIYWSKTYIDDIVKRSINQQLIVNNNGILQLTDKGRYFADKSLF